MIIISNINKKFILSKGFSSIKGIDVLSEKSFGGTLPYISPFLFSGKFDFSVKTDIYAIGVTLFTIITNGHFPYTIPDFIKNINSVKIFSQAEIDEKIKKCILKCISLEDSEIYSSYDEIISYLEIKIFNNKDRIIESSINYIQTLRQAGLTINAEVVINDMLGEYNEHLLLINQKAIIIYNKGNIPEYLNILENYIYSYKNDNDIYFLDPLFNLALYYFQNDILKMKLLLDKYKYLLVNEELIILQYPEYSIYLGISQELNKAFVFLNEYLTSHIVIDKILIFYFVLCIRLEKIKQLKKILQNNKSAIANKLNDIVIDNNIELNISADYFSKEMFGGLI